jgi:hypothetical protein
MPRRPRRSAPLSDREELLFEAGIKLGGLFHQYIGVPVSRGTAPGLARAIAAAIRLQPYVRAARIRIAPSRGGPSGRGRFAYRYLTAEMLEATVTLARGKTRVSAHLAYEPSLRYPLMRVLAEGRAGKRPSRRAARSARR